MKFCRDQKIFNLHDDYQKFLEINENTFDSEK